MADPIDDAGPESRIEDIDPAEVQPSIQSVDLGRASGPLHPHLPVLGLLPGVRALLLVAAATHCRQHSASECHRFSQKSHWMSTVSDLPGQALGKGTETYHYSPLGPDPKLMPDCSLFTGLADDHAESGWPTWDEDIPG